MRTFIFLCCTLAFAVGTNNGIAQDANIEITSNKTLSVKQVFQLINKQTDYKFIYRHDLIKSAPDVILEKGTIKARQLLDKCLAPINFTYEFTDGETIVVKRKPIISSHSDLTVLTDKVQQFSISGTVADKNGQPLPGANIVEKGTVNGVTADFDGNFSLNVADGDATLVVSYIGFATKEVSVDGRAAINVILEESAAALDEIVVVGYGTQKKLNLTGAVDEIGGEALDNRPIPNLTQGLQGVLPNVNIVLQSGKPNEAPAINIRGTTSIGQGGNALILIDGVEGDPSMLNPNDVESISVLKDAASASVYGSRGAFGVILITTKKAEKEAFSITYNINTSLKEPTVDPNFVTDGYLWATMFNQSFVAWEGANPQNVNKTLPFSQEYLNELGKRAGNPNLPEVEIGPDGRYVYYGNTDWYDLLYKDALYSKEHNLSLSRSTEKANFMISGRYLGQDGLFRYNSDDYEMYNIRARGSMELFPWLEVNNNFDYSKRSYFNPLNVGEGSGIWRNIADEGHPLSPMLNPDGTITHSGAYTVGDFYYGKNGISTERQIFRNTTGLEAKFFGEKLKIIGDFTYQSRNNKELRRRVQVPFSRAPGVIEYVGEDTNDLRRINDGIEYIATNLHGEYEETFYGKHYIKAMVGANYEQSVFERLLVERNGLIFEDATDLNLALGQSINTEGGYEKWKILGGFYRLNYIFDERYLLELNGRYDGSSKFPENERYAFFPSVSAGWRVSQEPFWSVPDNIISHLQLRGSYGSLGSGNIDSYVFQQNFSISQSDRILNGFQPQRTSRPSVLPDNLTWETVTTKNIGLDMRMVSGRLSLSGDAYIRETTDMYTIGRTLPAIFGATSPRGNYADLRTTGWELKLGWRDGFDLGSKPFNYNFQVNLSDSKAKILRYNNPDKFLDDYYEGMEVGEIWGYITEGFFTSQEDIANHADQSEFNSTSWGEYFPGDIKLKDINGDGVINPGDNTAENPGDRIIIGNTHPRYTFGVNLGADWNGFFFSAFFNGVGKQDWYPRYESNLFWGQYNRPYGDIPKWHLNEGIIWSEDNPDSFFPRYVSRLANRNGAILREEQSKYTMNAAFIRLKNFQIGYNLPSGLFSRINVIKGARIYFSAENIWSWSPLYRKVDNIDVENATAPSDQLFTDSNAGDGYNYPMLKSMTLGLSVTF